MRYREPWSLYRRRSTPEGPEVWYYRTYDEHGHRTTGRSTGTTSKTLANDYCARLYREGRLIPSADVVFEDYAGPWWIWGRCEYIRGRLERSAAGKPSISERYASDMRKALENRLLPRFGKMRLSAISPELIERWALQLRDEGLSGKGVNNLLSCLRVMLSEAYRLGRIHRNPFAVVRPLGVDNRDRGVLSIEEVQKLFARENIEPAWKGHLLYRCLNLVGACTGCRQGELLALRDEAVHPGWLHIAHSWSPVYGLGPTKTRLQRDVPLPSRALEDLQPFLGTGGFVFSMNRGKTPVARIGVNDALYAALEKIGIPEAERRARNITFHGWRHWLNSVLRARKVADPLVRRVTGHATAEMSEHYSHFVREDFAPVLAIQSEVFPSLEAMVE